MEEKKGAQLYTKICGDGEPLLLIHGIISDSSFFEETSAYLSGQYQVITYDRRGYGKSTTCVYEDFSVREQALDAAGILKSTCTTPAWVVGNSAGGLIATELALQYPQLIRGMILVEPSFAYEEQASAGLRAWNQELNEYVRQGKPKRALPAFTRVIGGGEENARPLSLAQLRNTYRNLEVFLGGELNEVQNYLPPLEKLQKLSVPTVIAVTEKGRESIFATSSRSAAELIGWPVEILPGWHNVASELPQEFAVRIREIFGKMEEADN